MRRYASGRIRVSTGSVPSRIVFGCRRAILNYDVVSQPALKAISRLQLHRVATPVPRTMSRRDALVAALAEADARIKVAYELLSRDALSLSRLDWPAFRARVESLLLDLDTSTELVTALIPLSPAEETTLHERAQRIGEQRQQLHRWLKQIGAR